VPYKSQMSVFVNMYVQLFSCCDIQKVNENIINVTITGSAVALHCCKAHSKINRKMEISTPCKILTPENFILKLGIPYLG